VKIRFVTYNIHRAIGVDRRFRLDRVAEILSEHAPHIVFLQEVDRGAPRSRRLDLARELAGMLDFPEFVAGHNVWLKEGTYGNAILSRFPIVEERNIDLTVGRRKRRGCLFARAEVPHPSGPVEVNLFNVHLGLSARERLRQIERLLNTRELLELPFDVPCILGGDFNDWRSQLRSVLTTTSKFRCATDRRTASGIRAIPSYPSFAPSGALDRLYYRGQWRLLTAYACRHQLAKVASDHLPVIVELALLRQGSRKRRKR